MATDTEPKAAKKRRGGSRAKKVKLEHEGAQVLEVSQKIADGWDPDQTRRAVVNAAAVRLIDAQIHGPAPDDEESRKESLDALFELDVDPDMILPMPTEERLIRALAGAIPIPAHEARLGDRVIDADDGTTRVVAKIHALKEGMTTLQWEGVEWGTDGDRLEVLHEEQIHVLDEDRDKLRTPEEMQTVGEVLDAAAEHLQDVVDEALGTDFDDVVDEDPDHAPSEGQTALKTGDDPTITTKVKGPRPLKATLKVKAPKPIVVKRDYQPGEKVLFVMAGAVGFVNGLGGDTREHETHIVDSLLWEDPHIEPGTVLNELREVETRPQFTRAVIDKFLRMLEDEGDVAHESHVDLVAALREKAYEYWRVGHLPAPPVAEPAKHEVDDTGVLETPSDRAAREARLQAASNELGVGLTEDSFLGDDGPITAMPEEGEEADAPGAQDEHATKILAMRRRYADLEHELDVADRNDTAQVTALSDELEHVREELAKLGVDVLAEDEDVVDAEVVEDPTPPSSAEPQSTATPAPDFGTPPGDDEVEKW